ncbi:MAG: putative dehydrogenase [Verrucomicrobiales bacterium]|jgi:predicted dehydrogenase
MKLSKPVKIGLVGTGGIAQSYREAFLRVGAAELIAVADADPSRVKTAPEVWGCPGYASAEEMFDANKELEAIIICTPPNTHESISCAALDRGIHVLCEKPLSTTSASAERMRDAAEKAGKILTMASKFRYVCDVVAAKELVSYGKIGDIILFENAFTSFVDMSGRWNADPAISGGGVLIDNGTHSLDIARYFLGPIKELRVIEGRRCQGLDVEETVNIFIKSEEGVLGNIDLSWTIQKPLENYVQIHGSKGTLCIGWKDSKYRIGNGEWISFGKGYDKVRAFMNQISNFSKAIRGEGKLRVTAQDGVASVRAVEAAYKALQDEPWTKVRRSKVSQADKQALVSNGKK